MAKKSIFTVENVDVFIAADTADEAFDVLLRALDVLDKKGVTAIYDVESEITEEPFHLVTPKKKKSSLN